MNLKHNSIRSKSRVKSSALIVCWQALPALRQTQCYQGTEGRFVCTGRVSCCVRPACPRPEEHRGARLRTGAAVGSGRQGSTLAPVAGSLALGQGALAGDCIQAPHAALWLGEPGQISPGERHSGVNAVEGQGSG